MLQSRNDQQSDPNTCYRVVRVLRGTGYPGTRCIHFSPNIVRSKKRINPWQPQLVRWIRAQAVAKPVQSNHLLVHMKAVFVDRWFLFSGFIHWCKVIYNMEGSDREQKYHCQQCNDTHTNDYLHFCAGTWRRSFSACNTFWMCSYFGLLLNRCRCRLTLC